METQLKIGKIYQFTADRKIYRVNPDIIPIEKDPNDPSDPKEEVLYMKDVIQFQAKNKIEIKSGQIILIIKNDCLPPKYLGEKYGKWGMYYFRDDDSGSTVLHEDQEYWLSTEERSFLEEIM